MINYVYPDELPQCHEIQEWASIHNRAMRHLAGQNIEVAMDEHIKWHPIRHVADEVHNPLQLCIMQPCQHAIIKPVLMRRGSHGFLQDAP